MTTTSSTPVAIRPTVAGRALRVVRRYGTLIGLLLIIVIFAIASPTVFLSPINLRNVLEQMAVLTVIASVQTAVMVVGDFDLSVGACASFSAIVAAVALHGGVPVPMAVVLALAAGALIGLVNGFLVAYIGLSAFIATLASMTSIIGLAFILSGGTTLIGFPAEFLAIGQGRLLGLPYTVFIAALVLIVMSVVLSRTTLGRTFYAIGGNSHAAELSGVNVSRARFTAFIIVGVGSALGGIFLVSRL
ncbi:MAG TPA: ABC transporter permease, partial [Pseudolysinimonas sp.]|nr:ABC transporter permease [Pseudolysinimonas sp.]